MISLKKSFEVSNYYGSLMQELHNYLNGRYAVKIVEKHFRSKSYSDAEDEVIERPKPYELDKNITVNDIIEFAVWLNDEICKLNKAVSLAKNSAEENFDSMVAGNAAKRRIIDMLSDLAVIKSTETKSEGTARKFNDSGEQVSYTYPVEVVKTIDFDRNAVKKQLNALRREAEKTSEEIELMKLNLMVEYEPALTIGDTFEDAVLTYKENAK